MSQQPIPPLLIKANIALFKGERAEVLRLLQQYENERAATDDLHANQVMWMRAQAQPTDDARIEMLYDLIGRATTRDAYTRMAREYLEAEESFDPPPPSSAARWTRLGLGVATLFILVLGGTFLLGALGESVPEPTPVAQAPTPTPTVLPPDLSQPLLVESFTRQYESGILSILAFEDPSRRVTDTQTGGLVEPVAGARFYGLQARFECRSGICNTPPEAEITLRTDNDDVIPLRGGVTVAGAAPMEAIALGRTTSGWLVFELPSLSRAEELIIVPILAEEDAPPIVIELGDL
ncbi:MAG: hypothetical protein AAF125_00640 [Chloroflexota bacterium]